MKDRLDSAIDAVAGRLMDVREDTGLALRIVEALPQRSTWSWRWLMPRLAITAVLAIGMTIVVLRTFDEGSTNVLRTNNNRSTEVLRPFDVSSTREPLAPATSDRRTHVEPTSNDRRTTGDLSLPDHERSLVAIAAPEALLVAPLSPSELPAEGALTIAPLSIVDLQLSESFSPHQ